MGTRLDHKTALVAGASSKSAPAIVTAFAAEAAHVIVTGRSEQRGAEVVEQRRLEEEHRVECDANAAYEAYRARGVMKDGRRFGRLPNAFQPPAVPAGKINLTDLDSRNVKTSRGWVQGYNARAATNTKHIVIAAVVNADSPDFCHLQPMVDATQRELRAIGIDPTPEVVLADAGYWHQDQMENIINRGIQVLIA
jgi:NAD(P)-dependent dehydrogenase (short-subunit alcohol dehydrogenase family)